MGKEYKQLKDIKLQTILDLDNGPFKSECLERLADCGFIEEEEGMHYHAGQHFRYGGNEYVLAWFGEKRAALVNIESGWSWSGIRSAQDPRQITLAEFVDLSGSLRPSEFRLVKSRAV